MNYRNQVAYLSDRDLATRYRVDRSTIWRWVKNERFPKPVQLSPGCSRWRLSEVEEHEAEAAA